MTPVKRSRWYWKTETGYRPVRLSEFRDSPIIKLLTETHCLIDGEYVRCMDITDHAQRDHVMAEFRQALTLIRPK